MGIENSGDFSWSDVYRDGEELGKGGVSNRITGIKIWLEGDIAKEYDIAYRAFIYGQGWTERFHSNGGSQDDAELCGSDDASGSKGAIKCIQVFAIPKPARCQAGTRVRRGQFVYPGKLPFGWLSHGTGDARAQPR